MEDPHQESIDQVETMWSFAVANARKIVLLSDEARRLGLDGFLTELPLEVRRVVLNCVCLAAAEVLLRSLEKKSPRTGREYPS